MDRSREKDTETLRVPMVDPEIVKQIRALAALGWGTKRIARELGCARNSVRRYLREGAAAETQTRPGAWTLDAEQQQTARVAARRPAAGNGVVVQRLLAEQDVDVPLRTLQRVLAPHRQEKRAAELATVRFETAPGHQMQIDFGEKWIVDRRRAHSGALVRRGARLLAPDLRARVAEPAPGRLARGPRRRVPHFGGVTQRILIDRAGALVVGDDRETGTARVHPGVRRVLQGLGRRRRGVSAVSRAHQGQDRVRRRLREAQRDRRARSFTSFAALEAHLARWMRRRRSARARHDARAAACDRFERDERPRCARCRRGRCRCASGACTRRVATDCFVDVDTIRYSVPHRLVRAAVEVLVGERRGRRSSTATEVARAPPQRRAAPARRSTRATSRASVAAARRGATAVATLADRPQPRRLRRRHRRCRVTRHRPRSRRGATAQAAPRRRRGAPRRASCRRPHAPSRPISTSSTRCSPRRPTPSRRSASRWASRSRTSRR